MASHSSVSRKRLLPSCIDPPLISTGEPWRSKRARISRAIITSASVTVFSGFWDIALKPKLTSAIEDSKLWKTTLEQNCVHHRPSVTCKLDMQAAKLVKTVHMIEMLSKLCTDGCKDEGLASYISNPLLLRFILTPIPQVLHPHFRNSIGLSSLVCLLFAVLFLSLFSIQDQLLVGKLIFRSTNHWS